MKKNLLIIASLSLFSSVNAQILTYVGDEALLQVEDQALVYCGGGWKVDGSTAAKKGKVDSFGDILLDGSTTDEFSVLNSGEFNLKTKTTTFDHLTRVYGQLYLTGFAQGKITGKVQKEYYEANQSGTDNTGRQQMAFPFKDYSFADLDADLGAGNLNTNLNRYNNGNVFRWNNTTASFDHIRSGNMGNPTDYFIVPKLPNGAPAGGTVFWTPNSTTPKIFKGVPISDEDVANFTKKALTGAFGDNGETYGTGGNNINNYNGRYNSYIDDFISDASVTKWTGTGWGMNMYQLGNPFLTNIDLSLAHTGTDDATTGNGDGNNIPSIEGYYYYDEGSILNDRNQGTFITDAAKVVVVKVSSTGVLSGGKTGTNYTSATSLVIRPMQVFIMKLRSKSAPTLDLLKTRRFAQNGRADNTKYHVTTEGLATANTHNQLGISLLDANGVELGRTFYIVSNIFENGVEKGVSNQSISPYASIFTKEESPAGGADKSNDFDLHINAANAITFAGKEIPLVINSDKAAKLKFFITEEGRSVNDGKNLSNGKAFYIKKDNVLTKISNGDEVTINNGTYGLFYEKPATTVATPVLSSGETYIGKFGGDFIVRFSKDWKSANVEIYSAAGQLLHTKKNVNTNSDYILPVSYNSTSLILVRVTSDKGEVVTKKIIK